MLLLPLFGTGDLVRQAVARTEPMLVSKSEVLAQNRALRLRVQELELQLLRLEELQRENERLRTELGWQRQSPWKLRAARVIARDPANWWRAVQIDLGTRDGLRENLPVLTHSGLVGKVVHVDRFHSRVALVGDPNCKVSVVLGNTTRDCGIIQGCPGLDPQVVELAYLPRAADVAPGQSVFTSGLGGVFPAGIPVGTVLDVQESEYGMYKVARVRLNVNPGGLDIVWVILQ